MKIFLLFPPWNNFVSSKSFIDWGPNSFGDWNVGVNQCSPCTMDINHISCASFADNFEFYIHKNNPEVDYPICQALAVGNSTAPSLGDPETVRIFESVKQPACDATERNGHWSAVGSGGCEPFAEKISIPESAHSMKCGDKIFTMDFNRPAGAMMTKNPDWMTCRIPGIDHITPKHLGASCSWKPLSAKKYKLKCIATEFENVALTILPLDMNARIEVNDHPVHVGVQGAEVKLYDVPPVPWKLDETQDIDSTPQWMQWVKNDDISNTVLNVDVGCGCRPGGEAASEEGDDDSLKTGMEIHLEKLPVGKGSLNTLYVTGCELHPPFDPLIPSYVVICNGETDFKIGATTDEDMIINRRMLNRGASEFKVDIYRNAPTTTTFSVVSKQSISDCTETEECVERHGPHSICAARKTCRLIYASYSVVTLGGSVFDERAGMFLSDSENGKMVTNYAKVVPTFEGKSMPQRGPPHMAFDCKRCEACTADVIKTFDKKNLSDCLKECRLDPFCNFISHSFPECRLYSDCQGAPDPLEKFDGRWARYHACKNQPSVLEGLGLAPPKVTPRPPGTVLFFGQPGSQGCIIEDLNLVDTFKIPDVNVHLGVTVRCLPHEPSVTLYFTGRDLHASEWSCDQADVQPYEMDNLDAPDGTKTIAVTYALHPHRGQDQTNELLEARTPTCRGKEQSFSLKLLRSEDRAKWVQHKLNDGLSPRCRAPRVLNIRHDYPVTSVSPQPQDCIMMPSIFDPEVKTYQMSCPDEVTSVAFNIVLEDPSARVLVNGKPIDSDVLQWYLDAGENPLGAEFSVSHRVLLGQGIGSAMVSAAITVACEGKEENYTINLKKGSGLKPEIVALTIEQGKGCKLTPEWQPEVLDYDIYCPEETEWVALQPRVPDQNANMIVNGDTIGAGDELDPIKLDYGGTYVWNIQLAPPSAEGQAEGSNEAQYTITVHRYAPIGLTVDSTKIMASVFSSVGIGLAIMSGANFMQVARFLQFLALMVAIKGTPQGFCTFAKSFSALNLQFGHIDKIFPSLKKMMPFDVEKFKEKAALAAGLPMNAVHAILDQQKSMIDTSQLGEISAKQKELQKKASEQMAKLKAIRKRYKKKYELYKKNFAKAKAQFMKQKSLIVNLFLLPMILGSLLLWYGLQHLFKSMRWCGMQPGSNQVMVNEFRPSFLLLLILDIGLIGFIRASTEIYFKGTQIQILIPLGSTIFKFQPSKEHMSDFVLVLFFLYPVGFLAFAWNHLHSMKRKIVFNKFLGKYVDRECVEIKAVEDVPVPIPFLGNFLAKANIQFHYNITQISPIKWIRNAEGKFIFHDSERESIKELAISIEKTRDNRIIFFNYESKDDPDAQRLAVQEGDELIKIDADRTFNKKSIKAISKQLLDAKNITFKSRDGQENTIEVPQKNHQQSFAKSFRRFSIQVYKQFNEEKKEEKKGSQGEVQDREECHFMVSGTKAPLKLDKNFEACYVVNSVHGIKSKQLHDNQDQKRDVFVSTILNQEDLTKKKPEEKWVGVDQWPGLSLDGPPPEFIDESGEDVKPEEKNRYKLEIRDNDYSCHTIQVKFDAKEGEDNVKEESYYHRICLERPMIETKLFGLSQSVTGERLCGFDEKDNEAPLYPPKVTPGWFARRLAVKQIPETILDDNAVDHVSSMVVQGFVQCNVGKSQLLVMLRDDENALRGSITIEATNDEYASLWDKEVKEWVKEETSQGGYAASSQQGVKQWLADAATKSQGSRLAPEGTKITAHSGNVPKIQETDVRINGWKRGGYGKILCQFSIVLKMAPCEREGGEQGKSDYSQRSSKFLEWGERYFNGHTQENVIEELVDNLGYQGFDVLRTPTITPIPRLSSMNLCVSTYDKDPLHITDIKESALLMKRIGSKKSRLDTVLEYEGSPVLKNAAPNDRFEIWVSGPAIKGNEVFVDIRKALFISNIGAHAQQQYVRVCLDSHVFRGEEQLECRASVQKPNELLRVTDSKGYEPLTEEVDDRIKLMRGMSPAGIPYRLSPVYEMHPEGRVGTKTFPINVLAQTNNGIYGFRMVSTIKVGNIPQLHWYCPNYVLDVPQAQLVFPDSDTWGHFYGGMKENQRMHWFISRAILLCSICLVAFYGSFKENIDSKIDKVKSAVSNAETSVVKSVHEAVDNTEASAVKAVHDGAHQGVKINANGVDQTLALMCGTFLTFAIAAWDDIGGVFADKEADRTDEQEGVNLHPKNIMKIVPWYWRPENRTFIFGAIWEGESFMYAAEIVLLVVLLLGMEGLLWTTLDSYLLIFIAGGTIFVMNMRFLAKKWEKFKDWLSDLPERAKAKAEEVKDGIKNKIEWVISIPQLIKHKIEDLKEKISGAVLWTREIVDKVLEGVGMAKAAVKKVKSEIDEHEQAQPLLVDEEAPEEPEFNPAMIVRKRGSIAAKEMQELVHARNVGMVTRCKNLFCQNTSLQDLPEEIAIKQRQSFHDHVEEQHALKTSWHKGDTVFEATPTQTLKSLVNKGEHKIKLEKSIINDEATAIELSEMSVIAADTPCDKIFVSKEVMFEDVDLFVDAIGLHLHADIIPDKHNFIPKKRLVVVDGGVNTARNIVNRVPVQLEHEDFVAQSIVPRTLVGTLQVVNCAKIKLVDKPENDSYLSLYASHLTQPWTALKFAQQCSYWLLNVLNWVEKQGAETVMASKLNKVIDALFWGNARATNRESLLQQYQFQNLACQNDQKQLMEFLTNGTIINIDPNVDQDNVWKGFIQFFNTSNRPNYVGYVVKSLQQISAKPELLHVVMRSDDLRAPAKDMIKSIKWNPPMIQAVQAEKFEITPMKVGIGAPGMLRLMGNKFTFSHPVKVDATYPEVEEIKFEKIQSVLANVKKKQVGEKTVPGETLYLIMNTGPVIAFVLSPQNIDMWNVIVARFGLSTPKPSILGHEGPTIKHPTESGIRLRHGHTGSQTWYADGKKKNKSAGAGVLDSPKAGGGRSSIAMLAIEEEEGDDERIEKGRYEGGWNLHKYNNAGRLYCLEYSTSSNNDKFKNYSEFNWGQHPVFQRETNIYDGLWKQGHRHGKGTFFFPIGPNWYFFDGIFHDGNPIFGFVGAVEIENVEEITKRQKFIQNDLARATKDCEAMKGKPEYTEEKEKVKELQGAVEIVQQDLERAIQREKGSQEIGIRNFIGSLKRLNQIPHSEFPWITPVEMFVALSNYATSGDADLLRVLTVGHVINKLREVFKKMAKNDKTLQKRAEEINKEFKKNDIEVGDVTAFDIWCLERVVENCEVSPLIKACRQKGGKLKGKSNLVLPQKLPQAPVTEIAGNDKFLRSAFYIWFHFEVHAYNPPFLSIAENNKQEHAMEALMNLPPNAPLKMVKHCIGSAKRHGNDDKKIRSELKKKFVYEGELPPWKEKLITAVAAEDVDASKRFFYDLQIKYLEILKQESPNVTDYGERFSTELAEAMPTKRTPSMIFREQKKGGTVAVKGVDVQDAMNDESELGLYQMENDLWLQGKALLSWQPENVEGHIQFHKDHKVGFDGTVRDGLLFGEVDMTFRGQKIKTIVSGGKVNGECKLSIKDAYYDGVVKDGQRIGKGKFVSGSYSYEGEWEDDKRHGSGTLETSNFMMQGRFEKNAPVSFEYYRVKDQGPLCFQCNNKPDHAEFTFPIAGKPVKLRHDRPISVSEEYIQVNNNNCELKDERGNVVYSGPIQNNAFNGEGKMIVDEYTYSGGFKDGVRSGRGTMKYSKIKLTTSQYAELNGNLEGTSWEGGWKDDKPHGEGTLTFIVDGNNRITHECFVTDGVPPPSPAEKKKGGCVPCKCGSGENIPEYPNQMFHIIPPTTKVPGSGKNENGFSIRIKSGSDQPPFDVAAAAHVPDNLLHEILHDISGGLVSEEMVKPEPRAAGGMGAPSPKSQDSALGKSESSFEKGSNASWEQEKGADRGEAEFEEEMF